MICGRRGEGGALVSGSREDNDFECPCEPKRVLDAILKARLSAFDAAREATLEGDDERGGAFALGGGGNVICPAVDRYMLCLVTIDKEQYLRSCKGRRGCAVISSGKSLRTALPKDI
jgi:hypothetical protein